MRLEEQCELVLSLTQTSASCDAKNNCTLALLSSSVSEQATLNNGNTSVLYATATFDLYCALRYM